MNISEAARLLSVRESEIAAVDDSPAGPIITTRDGVRYVDVPKDRPDDDGETGLMFLVAPSETYGGAFPVYAQPGDVTLDDIKEVAETLERLVPEVAAVTLQIAELLATEDGRAELEQFLLDREASGDAGTDEEEEGNGDDETPEGEGEDEGKGNKPPAEPKPRARRSRKQSG